MVVPTNMQRLAGVADTIANGDAPIAMVRIVERPDLARAIVAPGATLDLALHLRPETLTPVADARAAGELVAQRARDLLDTWNGVRPGLDTPDDRFPYQAALMARDGQWYVAALAPHLDGRPIANFPYVSSAINNAIDPVATRADESLRMVAHEGAGFTFRRGLDTAQVRRAHELPQTVLGDGYQSSIVDAHVARAREAMPALEASLDDLVPTRHGWSLHKAVRHGERGMIDLGHARTPVKLALEDARHEMNRLLPDELAALPADDALRTQVAAHTERLQAAMDEVHATILTGKPYDPVDVDSLRATIRSLRDQLDALPGAPSSTARSQLPEFDAFMDRLTSKNLLARDAAMRTFEYDLFGRTPGERMRNVGVALETLHEGSGYDLRSVIRLKGWLRDLADDAALVRRELPEEHRQLAPLLDQVEEHARRNGVDGVVTNAQGVIGYDVYPDFAEVGRMGAALRTFLAIDDATGRLAPALAEAIPAERLVW